MCNYKLNCCAKEGCIEAPNNVDRFEGLRYCDIYERTNELCFAKDWLNSRKYPGFCKACILSATARWAVGKDHLKRTLGTERFWAEAEQQGIDTLWEESPHKVDRQQPYRYGSGPLPPTLSRPQRGYGKFEDHPQKDYDFMQSMGRGSRSEPPRRLPGRYAAHQEPEMPRLSHRQPSPSYSSRSGHPGTRYGQRCSVDDDELSDISGYPSTTASSQYGRGTRMQPKDSRQSQYASSIGSSERYSNYGDGYGYDLDY